MSTSEKDVERFDQWAKTYESSFFQRLMFNGVHRATIDLATQFVPHPSEVLDVGCGTGRLLRLVHAQWPNAHLTGIDPADRMIELAERLTPQAKFHVGMAEAIPLTEESFDLALSTFSLHHWQNQAAGVKEVARVLRPGGCFILVDTYMPRWLGRVLQLKRFRTIVQLQTMFHLANLRVQTHQVVAWFLLLATVGKKS